jgi:autotransporter translocation and assembly factor TamB
MRKKPIFIFFAIVAILIGSAAIYIQSAAFARQVKRAVAKYVPSNFGIETDFTNFSIQLFPPGVGIVNPRIEVEEKNAANLPKGTRVEAERMSLSFRPLQILSGRISIYEVKIENGRVQTALEPPPQTPRKKKRAFQLSWQDLFEIQTERVKLENTAVELTLPAWKSRAEFNAKSVEIGKGSGDGEFYEVFIQLGDIRAETPPSFPYPNTVDDLKVSARLDANGLDIKDFELVREGTQIVAQGKVDGDVLRGGALKADVALKLQGDVARMLGFLSRNRKESTELPRGHIAFDGRAKMDLARVPETLSASGKLQGENLSFRRHQFDRVEIEGSYTASEEKSAEADEVIVKRALLSSARQDKKGGERAGWGGTLELGSFRYNLKKPAPIETTLSLKDAHLHWLGAELLEELYALDGRVTGESKLKITPPGKGTPFELRAEVDWKVDGLQIDNQKMGQKKPLNRIIHVKDSALKGTVIADVNRVRFDNMSLGVTETQFAVNGEIAYAKGKTRYDITGTGPVDLKEIGIIAEVPIEGTGPLGIRVHGPAEKVLIDFDGSLQDVTYLNLNFGGFRGRITWDDADSRLYFRNLDCNRGRTAYRLDGKLDLGLKESMDLRVAVPFGGSVNEFLSIFSGLTEELDWFPSSLLGEMGGELRIHGGIALETMLVDAKITGNRWEYFGERFSRVTLEGGYDRGKYYLSGFEATKRHGKISGSISMDARSNYEWKIASEGMGLSDMDHIASLDIPLRGSVSVVSSGKGPEKSLDSKTEFRLSNAVLRGKRLEDSFLLVESRGGRARAEGKALGDRASVKALYDFTTGRESHIEVKADALDFSPVVLLLNPSLMNDAKLSGTVSGSFRLDFLTGQAEVGSGQVRIHDYSLRKTGAEFSLDRAYDFKIDRGSFSIPSLTLNGDGGKTTLSVRSESGKVSGWIRGDLDLSLAEFLTSSVEKADGSVRLDLTVGGTLKEPTVKGAGRIRNAMARIEGIETPIENIRGRFDTENGKLSLGTFSADLASGRVSLIGEMDFFLAKWPTMDLELELSGNKLKVYPFQVAKVRGKLNVSGEERPYLVGGKIFVENAISREKLASARGPGLRSAQYLPPQSTLPTASVPLFRLDIGVSAPGNVIVKNELMDLEARGDLRIVGTIDNPRPLGNARAVQGRVLFKDRAFQIQNAVIDFDNPTVLNPRYEVLAFTEIANRRIQLFSSGRFDNQKFEFSSNPPMPEPEILNLLALGVTTDESRKFRSADRSAYEQGEAASLVLHSLDFNREIQNKTGIQIGIDEAFDERLGMSAFSRATSAEAATAPKIVIRRKFGQRFGLSAGSTVGVGTSIQREVNAEVNVTKGLSVIGVWDSIEGVTTEDPKRNSFGVDLKLQRRFK